jgi:hypothetical protein
MTIEDSKVHSIKVDPIAAASTAQGALVKIMAFRPQILTDVPNFDITLLDKLETYSLGLIHAHTLFLGANTPPAAVTILAEEVGKFRELLLSDASALTKRGLLHPAQLSELKGPAGFRNIATDVITVVNILRGSWAIISSKTGVTAEELNNAEVVAVRLINTLATRAQTPAALTTVNRERQQAYTLFINAYDQVRRAISFLRWDKDDADSIAPSLYAGRNTSHKKNGTDIEVTTETPATAPATAAVGSTTVTAPAATTTPTVAKVAAGFPGFDPFLSS